MKRRTFTAAMLSVTAAALLPARRAFAASADVPALHASGKQFVLSATDIEDLRASLRGELLTAGQAGYDEARRIWNGAFDRRPAFIVRCKGAADVIQCVNFARSHDLLVAVRGGGHSLSGQSVCDGGLMIDLSRMRGVRVDPDTRRALAEPGVLLGELDRETQAFGLATPAGTVSHTGIAGLTLGGGFGRIARRFGLTCDNLVSAEVVTADGRLVRASLAENADLLWGLRGGGGNFGIVTLFEYQLHPVDPRMYGGSIIFAFEAARDVLHRFSDIAQAASDDFYADAALVSGRDGKRILAIDTCYSGPLANAERVFKPLRSVRKPLQDLAGPSLYVSLQTSGDETNRAGRGNYERSGFLRRIEPLLVDEILERLRSSGLPGAQAIFVHHGGAISRTKPVATAFWHRDAQHSLLVQGAWDDPAGGAPIMEWARKTWAAVESQTNGFYVNTVAADDPKRRIRAAYGENYAKLVALKKKYDPSNLFRRNANIEPAP
jgi:FAD/FMN-containing dehydrogenase